MSEKIQEFLKRIKCEEHLKDGVKGLCGRFIAKDSPSVAEEDLRWRRIQAFLQEVFLAAEFLRWRVLCKRYGEQPGSPLFAMTADTDGELTEESIIEQLEAIARQARAGFVGGPGFPVFGSLEDRVDI